MSRQVERGGKRKQRNLLHKKRSERKLRLVKKGATHTKEFRELVRQIRSIPAVEVNDPNFIRLKYLRYADDWLVGICGPRKLAEQVKEALKTFLCQRLKLTLPRGKDENHPCPQRAGPLSRDTISHWKRGHSTGRNNTQRIRAAYQAPLDWLRNCHDGPKRRTHQETPYQRLLYSKGETHHEARMDTSGCRSDHPALQRHQSRDTKLLPLCGQLRTPCPYSIYSQILTCSYTGNQIQMRSRAKSSNALAKSLPSSSKQKMENETAVSHSTTTATGKSNATAFKPVRRQSICSDGASVCDHAQNWECHAASVAVQSK